MPDEITIRATEQRKYPLPPTGSQPGVCVDVIDLGETMESYMGGTPEKKHKVVLVFQTDEENEETGKRFEPSIEFTASFGPKANLRKFLGSWRGKPYTDEEAERDGAPLHKLVGANAILNIQHKQSKSNPDRVYAIIKEAIPPMKGQVKLVPHKYERSEHWTKRKQEYAQKVYEYELAHPAPAAPDFNEVPAALQNADDDLPF